MKFVVLCALVGASMALEANLDFMFNWTKIEDRKGCRFSDYISAKKPVVDFIPNAPMDYLFMQNIGMGIMRVTRQCPLIADGEECHWVGPVSSGLDGVGGQEMSCPVGEFVVHVRCNNEQYTDCLGFDFMCCKAKDGRVTDFQREQWAQEIEGMWNVDQMPRSECAKWPVIDEVIVGFHCRGEKGCQYPKSRCAPLVQPDELSPCSWSGDFADGESSTEGPVVKQKCTGAGCSVLDVQQCPLLAAAGECQSAGVALSDETVTCPEGQFVNKITNVGGGLDLCCVSGDQNVDHGDDKWTIEFSERFDRSGTEDLNRAACPQNHVMIGVHCRGQNCEYERLQCAPVGTESGCAWDGAEGPINAINVENGARVRTCDWDAGSECTTLPAISAQDEEAACPEGQFVTKVECSDDACSSVTLTCCAGTLTADHGDDNWSNMFSNEWGPNRAAHGHTHNPELPMTNMAVKNIVPEGRCAEDTVMIGMRCHADGCAQKRIRCAPLTDGDLRGCAVGLGDNSPATGLKCDGTNCETLTTKQCAFTQGSDCEEVSHTGRGEARCPEDKFVSTIKQDGNTVTVTCCAAEAGTVADHGQAIGWSPQITGEAWDETFTSNCPTHEIMFASLLCTSEAECEKQSMYCESRTFFYECPYDQVLVGVRCDTDDCNYRRFNCAPLLPTDERAECAWMDFYGEGNDFGADIPLPGAPIVSVRCIEPDCHTVATKQCDIIKPQEGSCFWRNDGLNTKPKCRHNCPAGMYIAGLRCGSPDSSPRNCNDLQYYCCSPADGEAQVINFVDQDFRSPEFTGSEVDRWRLHEAHCSYGTVLVGLICTLCDCNLKRALCAYTEYNWGDPLPNADLPLYNL